MARITVKAKIDGGVHPKYGEIKAGNEYIIEDKDFGAELFERPASDWFSPHEIADKVRATETGETVGGFAPQENEAAPASHIEEVDHV